MDCNTTWRTSKRSEHFFLIEAQCPYIPDPDPEDTRPRIIPHTGDNVVVATELEGVDPNDFSLKYCSRCKHPHYLLGDSDDLVDDYNLYCIACGSYLLSETVEEKASRLRRC